MRILMVSKACVVGQYQTKLEELARLPDIELTVVVPPFWRDERGIIPLERSHTSGYALLVEAMRFNGQFHFHYYPTLPRIIDRVRPAIVHIDEEPYNLATFLALRAARRGGAQTLFFTWQNLLRRYPLPFAWIESYVLRHADYALAGNAEAVAVLRAKGYRGSVSVIPQFGVDPNFFAPAAGGEPRQTFTIGYLGRLVEEKGIDLLLRAAAGLLGNWQVQLLGNGPAKEQLQSLARELGIASRVLFDVVRSSDQVPARYRQLDVLVLAARTRPNWKEQFGRVLIEAMACEIPVVASDCGEIPNVLGDAGLLFPEGAVAALRAQLETLQRDPARRRELGQRGRARVLAHFTQARIAGETWKVYEEMRRPVDR